MPKITVIVPVYNVEKYLRRCVDSILNQTYTDFELILVDDGSPDNCPQICDKYAEEDKRIHVIHQKNGGLSAARNTGIEWAFENSDSEWLSFIDSDDWVHCRYLELLYMAVKEEKAIISMCPLLKVEHDMVQCDLNEEANIKVLTAEHAYNYNGKGVTAYACGRLYNKNCFINIRYPIGKKWEDLFTTYKILFSTSKVVVVEEPLYYYFYNQNSLTHSEWTAANFDEIHAYKEQIDYFQNTQFEETYILLVKTYFQVISYQYDKMRYSRLGNQDKQYYKKEFGKMMRKAIRKYRKIIGLTLKDNTWYFEIAYPRIMQVYWKVKSLCL